MQTHFLVQNLTGSYPMPLWTYNHNRHIFQFLASWISLQYGGAHLHCWAPRMRLQQCENPPMRRVHYGARSRTERKSTRVVHSQVTCSRTTKIIDPASDETIYPKLKRCLVMTCTRRQIAHGAFVAIEPACCGKRIQKYEPSRVHDDGGLQKKLQKGNRTSL